MRTLIFSGLFLLGGNSHAVITSVLPFLHLQNHPLCEALPDTVLIKDMEELLSNDEQNRIHFLKQIFGPKYWDELTKLLGYVEPTTKVFSMQQALSLAAKFRSDPNYYQPVLNILKTLGEDRAWDAYLLSGFHEGCVHTRAHKDLVSAALEKAHAILGLQKNVRWLDVGPGDGTLATRAAMKYPHGYYSVIDISGKGLLLTNSKMLDFARISARKFNDPIYTDVGTFSTHHGDATNPNLYQGQYDVATFILSLFAFRERALRKKALGNAANTLPDGGIAIIGDPTDELNQPTDYVNMVIQDAYVNGTGLSFIGILMLTVMNEHNLLKIPFMSQNEIDEIAGEVNLWRLTDFEKLYFGFVNFAVYIKDSKRLVRPR